MVQNNEYCTKTKEKFRQAKEERLDENCAEIEKLIFTDKAEMPKRIREIRKWNDIHIDRIAKLNEENADNRERIWLERWNEYIVEPFHNR